jgi:C4-dicarboxylate transporter DctM subunit
MYVSCLVGKVSVMEFGREVWPFVVALAIALVIVTHVPWLALWLPDLLMPAR